MFDVCLGQSIVIGLCAQVALTNLVFYQKRESNFAMLRDSLQERQELAHDDTLREGKLYIAFDPFFDESYHAVEYEERRV